MMKAYFRFEHVPGTVVTDRHILICRAEAVPKAFPRWGRWHEVPDEVPLRSVSFLCRNRRYSSDAKQVL